MSFAERIKSIDLYKQEVAYRRPTTFLIGAHNLFTIVGGPVWIKALFARATVALAAGSTATIAICGVAADSGALNINSALNTLVIWPLQGANPPVPNAASQPVPTLAAALAGSFGQMASPGSAGGNNIVLTVAAANIVGQLAFYCVYQRMNEWSQINPV